MASDDTVSVNVEELRNTKDAVSTIQFYLHLPFDLYLLFPEYLILHLSV